MATKKASKVRAVDNPKLQEIIGRALVQPQFIKRLRDNPTRALAEYKLDKATEAQVLRGLKLLDQMEKTGQNLENEFGLEHCAV
jgi:hypothetical protein